MKGVVKNQYTRCAPHGIDASVHGENYTAVRCWYIFVHGAPPREEVLLACVRVFYIILFYSLQSLCYYTVFLPRCRSSYQVGRVVVVNGPFPVPPSSGVAVSGTFCFRDVRYGTKVKAMVENGQLTKAEHEQLLSQVLYG